MKLSTACLSQLAQLALPCATLLNAAGLLDGIDVVTCINLLQAGPPSPLNPNAPEFTPASSRGATPGGSPKEAAATPAANDVTAADGGGGQPQPMEGITVAIKPQVGLPVPQAQEIAATAASCLVVLRVFR